jgi:hypothetical protein
MQYHAQLQIAAHTAAAILPTYAKSLAKTILLTINKFLHCEFSNQLPQALSLRIFMTLEIPSSQTIGNWRLALEGPWREATSQSM